MNFLFNLSHRKKLLFFILSILCGFLDYLICDLVAWVNHLPLFCDTIFIMALSFFAGPWWGVLAGLFYHLIDFALPRLSSTTSMGRTVRCSVRPSIIPSRFAMARILTRRAISMVTSKLCSIRFTVRKSLTTICSTSMQP